MLQAITFTVGIAAFAAEVGPGTTPQSPAMASEPATSLNQPPSPTSGSETADSAPMHSTPIVDYWSMLFAFMLATFIGLGVITRVSRLLHTPLMSLTNAISAIAVVGSIIVTGSDFPLGIRSLGAIALFASMTNIVSGFLITDRMLKMFKQEQGGAKR
jgi:NAD(P) transhydrogenase subunit alpha